MKSAYNEATKMNLSGGIKKSLWTVLCLALPAFSAHAQSAGIVRGRVADASGAAVVRAKVRLKNVERGFNQETTTNDKGHFQFSNLPFETYTLIVSQSGFAEVSKQIGLRSTVLAAIEISLAAVGASERGTKLSSRQTDEEEPIITDRPDFTESPQTVPRRFKAQIESGLTFARVGTVKESSLGEVLVRVPVAERVELRFGVPNYVFVRAASGGNPDDRATGFDDAFFGAKIALSEGAGETGLFKKPAAALLVGTSLPTGARAFREDNLQPEAVLALSVDLTERFALSSNVGYVRASDGGERFNQVFGTLSLGAGLSKRVGAYLEVYGFTRVEAATRQSARFANGGVTFLVNKNFQLDARVGVGLGNHVSGPDYFFGFGFARRF